MKVGSVVQLAGRDLWATKARSVVSAVGIGLGVGVLVIIVGLGLGAKNLVLNKVVRELPLGTVEVVPKTLDLGLFQVGTHSLFGGAGLDAATVKELAALPQVRAAYPKLEVDLPMGARGGAKFFGRALYTDLFMTAVPSALIRPEAPGFVDRPGIVPVVISKQLIDVYNSSVAPAVGTPKLSAQSLTGFQFQLQIGRSLMLGSRGAVRTGVERARIVGTSRYAMQLGVTVPLKTARRLIATYGNPSAPAKYSAIILQARSAADVPAITRAVEGLGLTVDQTAKRTSDILTAVTLLASLVGLLVLALAALNIAHSFFASLSERRRELAILRAVGARRIDLVSLVVIQAVLLGAVGGCVGLAGARLSAWLIDAAAAHWVPDFPFKPDSFFSLPVWLFAAGFLAACLAAALGALWPALRAARAPVVRGLADP